MTEDTIDKRTVQRHKVLKGGKIVFDGNDVECTVRNLSSKGAALELASNVDLPPSFMLVIEADHLVRRCHPVWHSNKRVGVAFD